MVFRKVMIMCKPAMPLMLGVCLGITLSIIVSPKFEESCQIGEAESNLKTGSNKKADAVAGEDFDYGNSDDFEPRVRILEKSNVGNSQKSLMRPRYASTELGIREKLFVGVITSKNTIDTLGVAINKTLTHNIPKLVFFMNSRGPVLPSGLSVVIFSNEDTRMVPFHMMKYIADHYINSYDWFYFITDETYVRADKLYEFVENCSISNNFYVGKSYSNPNSGEVMCDIDGGILLSQHVMTAAIENLSWCRTSASTDDRKLNVGQCLLQASKEQCIDMVDEMEYGSYDLEHGSLDPMLKHLATVKEFRSAISVQHAKDDVTMYKLHRYYSELGLNESREELSRVQHDMESLAPQTPDGEEGLVWPTGVDPPSREPTRHDVLKWEYFTDTHIYLHSELLNSKPLSGVDKMDVQDVIKVSLERLNAKYSPRHFSLARLVNGYRRFDPNRGMDYIMDLALKVRGEGGAGEVIKRVQLLRPLSQVEIVPMPYVTEASRVNLVLPVKVEERDDVVGFLDSYASTCLDTGDNTHLYVVFLYNDENPMQNGEEDVFSVLKSMMSFYESKYQNGARIAWTALHNNNPTQFTVLDAISKKFAKETLFLLSTVGMELSNDFLNRVRMNTIQGWQVFFPMGFWQYKPSLIYGKHPYPTEINIDKKTGHFDENRYLHAAFYNADYYYARRQMISTSGGGGGSMNNGVGGGLGGGTSTPGMDLFDMFVKYHTVHVFRAIEPRLLHRFRELECPGADGTGDRARAAGGTGGTALNRECEESRDSSLASRQQLAMLLFQHHDSLDHAQLNVLQQQNQPKIDPMKVNMLKRK